MKTYDPNAPKPFSWSFSKLKNYKTCPFRYNAIDVQKRYAEDFSSPALAEGGKIHKAFELYVGSDIPLPPEYKNYEEHLAPLVNFPGTKLVEQKFAITQSLEPCTWFAKNAWYRGIADFLGLQPRVALAIDYKSGKVVEESQQLALLAECIFSHYPHIEAVRAEFWWLKEEAATKEIFYRKNRKETWVAVLPDVKKLEAAHAANDFPPTKTGLCKNHCIVTDCQFNGKRNQ